MDIGVCWLYGKDEEIYGTEPTALAKLEEEGFIVKTEWWFERYVPQRNDVDKKGCAIIDICFFVEP
jgi:hypothetical protein